MENVIIIGSGPAGLTSAIYTARANLDPLVFEGYLYGGQLMNTTDIENFPGFEEGISGPDLMTEMREQAQRFHARLVQKDVEAVDLSQRPFKVTVEGEVYESKSIIFATGANARMLGLDAEKRLLGRGVSTCATCDGFFYNGKKVVLIGGGDSAMEEAIFLTRFAGKVTVVHRRDELRASKIMQERALNNEKIEFAWNSVVEDILGGEKVEGVRLKNVKTGEYSDLPCEGFFLAIGHLPNTALIKGQVDLDEHGYVVTDSKSTATSVKGLFAAGDVQDRKYRQAITAAGSGCMAALEVEKFLEAEGA
ncbi:thioredoxin-disulfide reductase [candidate division KSB3 bacterium]|uniref:Thioredoxin reductase n=1 Tax=candidate division KSB3 bacterium TaxID=2044937 RepID=A0A2G6E4M8_9BACT|nr:MAG: thioredoxin-disulfide reductase [candidate division KSB3 bacterium]PIE29507.1 MAG: thioredoxin-disulfide reductase [candidate division KSB3 bacterium]